MGPRSSFVVWFQVKLGNFPYHSLFFLILSRGNQETFPITPSLVVGGIGVSFILFIAVLLFCSQFHWTAIWKGGLLLFCVWAALKICLLLAAENYCQLQSACGRDVGGIHAPWSFVFCSHCWRKLSGGKTIVGSARENEHCVPEGRISKTCRQFPNEFASTMLPTVVACYLVGQGLSCFLLQIIVGGDIKSAFYFLGQLIDGVRKLNWVRSSEVEPAKGEFHSFVHKQRQIEKSGILRVPITDIFSFCCSQPDFRSCRLAGGSS